MTQARTGFGLFIATTVRAAPRARSLAVLLAISAAFLPAPARAVSISMGGVTFSDELGGFVLEKVTGEGSLDDPFVIVERMTNPDGGTLLFQVNPAFGNRIGSQHTIGFAVIKVVENATDFAWTAFELELQSRLGIPSDYGDGLSFGQGSNSGKPFGATGFDQTTLMDEPTDRIVFDRGRIPIGGRVTLRFVISETVPLEAAYLVQRPARPVAAGPSLPGVKRLAYNRS